jgi:hypothetical protein
MPRVVAAIAPVDSSAIAQLDAATMAPNTAKIVRGKIQRFCRVWIGIMAPAGNLLFPQFPAHQ